jgi:type I restriction enzyme, S subunit
MKRDKKDWQLTRLGELISIKHGWPFRSQHFSDYQHGRPIVVNIGNFQYTGGFRFDSTAIKAYIGEYPKEFILKPGDILLVMTCQTAGGEILGIPGRIPNDERQYLHNQRMGKVVVLNRKRVDQNFLYWLFLTFDFNHHLVATASGAKILHTAPSRVESYQFQLPPLSTQRKIAAILSAYDDLIENNTRRIAILEEMAQSLYREWFVHFRFPGYEKKRMVESTLGMIPEGWEVVKLGDAVELAYGRALKADTRVVGEIPVYGSAGIIGYHNEVLVKGPGIIVGRKGNVGSIFWSDIGFFPIDTVFYVRSKICLHYIYYNLKAQHFINNDAAVPGLSRNQAYLLPFLLPSEETLALFQNFVSPLFNQIKKLTRKNAILRQTRDLLLPKLISGEVDVEGLDIHIEGDTYESGREPIPSIS